VERFREGVATTRGCSEKGPPVQPASPADPRRRLWNCRLFERSQRVPRVSATVGSKIVEVELNLTMNWSQTGERRNVPQLGGLQSSVSPWHDYSTMMLVYCLSLPFMWFLESTLVSFFGLVCRGESEGDEMMNMSHHFLSKGAKLLLHTAFEDVQTTTHGPLSNQRAYTRYQWSMARTLQRCRLDSTAGDTLVEKDSDWQENRCGRASGST
jgi:hypothetical protein